MKWLTYLRKEIWEMDLTQFSFFKRVWLQFLRIVVLISEGFTKSQIQQGASSLVYYTLLGIVPVIALIIAIAKKLALEEGFKSWMLMQFRDQRTVIIHLFDFADASLKNAHQGVVAGVGIAILLWAGLKIFLYIEHSFNKIWEVEKGHGFLRRLLDYASILLIIPIIILIASSMQAITAAFELTGIFALIFSLIPFMLTFLLLAFLYYFMPNTKVRFRPALYAGIITGILYQLVQWIYLFFQLGVTRYNAVYGTFAALPLFLIWLHLSWTVILIGAKVAFALQNVNKPIKIN